MSNENSQLSVVNGDGKLAAINAPQTCKDFVGASLGITVPKSTKEKPFTMKDLVVLALAAGHTNERIKALRKEHSAKVQQHYASSAVFMAAVSADPRFRKHARTSKDKDGVVNGWNFTVRRERSVNASMATRLASLEAQLAAANAKVLALTAPAAS